MERVKKFSKKVKKKWVKKEQSKAALGMGSLDKKS